MKVNILAFGALSEMIKSEVLETDDITDSDTLHQYLLNRYPDLKNKTYRVAVDRKLITDRADFSSNDCIEVALLPPFAGG